MHKVARDLDAKHLEKVHIAEIIAFKDRKVAERREMQMQKAKKQAEKKAFLASVDRVEKVEEVTDGMN